MDTHLKVLLLSKSSGLLEEEEENEEEPRFTAYSHRKICKATDEELFFYRLVAKQHVHIGHDLHEVILEKLGDKRRRQVQAKQLVGFGGMLGHFQDGLH